jgi:hypothetical protein
LWVAHLDAGCPFLIVGVVLAIKENIMAYAQEHRLLLAQHATAERALAANGHRLAYWDNTYGLTHFEAGSSRHGRAQIGHCACERAGVEIGVLEPAIGMSGYPMRLWGLEAPCPRSGR